MWCHQANGAMRADGVVGDKPLSGDGLGLEHAAPQLLIDDPVETLILAILRTYWTVLTRRKPM